MKPFTGQATLCVSGHQARVQVSLDMDAGALEAELPDGMLPEGLLQQGEGEPKEVTLSDLRIHLPSGTLSADHLPDITLGGDSSVTRSVKTSPIALALNLADDRSGTVRFSLHPKAAMIHLRHDPPLTDRCELYFLNNFIDHIPMTARYANSELYFQPRKESLSISSSADIRHSSRRLGVAWSVLQGAHATLAASYWDSDLELAVRKPRAYNRGHHLFRGWENVQSLLQSLTGAFLGMPDDEFSGWLKAVRFYIEGVNDDLDYDVRIVNFMVFIEMFDESATMSKTTIAETFAVSSELADVVVRMRNKIIHERMSMWRALPQVHSDILQHQPDWRCPEIDFRSRKYELLSILFFLHLRRMVNSFIVRSVNYSGRYDDCAPLIASIEKKLA